MESSLDGILPPSTDLHVPPEQVSFVNDSPGEMLATSSVGKYATLRPPSPGHGGSPADEDGATEMESMPLSGAASNDNALIVLANGHAGPDDTTAFLPVCTTSTNIASPKRWATMTLPNSAVPRSTASISGAHHPSSISRLSLHSEPAAVERMNDHTASVESHDPVGLPKFCETQSCMWTASHAANCPTEDRSASLVNLLLQPLPPNFDSSETQLPELEADYTTLIRLNFWCVIDGHGGGCVATYASEVLLPHIAASVSRALGCHIVDRGVCTVNGQLRDANALDLDGLIKTSERSQHNSYSVHYRSPYERSDSEDEGEDDQAKLSECTETAAMVPQTAREREQIVSLAHSAADALLVGTLTSSRHGKKDSALRDGCTHDADASFSSVKTSVKTAASPANQEALLGMHSPREVAAITRAITDSFLAVDEGWINSIDPVATHQTSCQSNGRWNSGACALVVFTIQRLYWTSVSEPDQERDTRKPEKKRRQNTSQNEDAARRRILDNASRAKSATSAASTTSSTSSLTTEEAVHASGPESEITEDEDRLNEDRPKRQPSHIQNRTPRKKETLISPPGGCSCHCYRSHDAMMYTAHVGDCRAVVLGSAPPRTIKVRGSSHPETTDDESSHRSSDETECLSSSDHDADSSEEEDVDLKGSATSAATPSYMNFPRRVVRQRPSRQSTSEDMAGPYIALPPLEKAENKTPDVGIDETDIGRFEQRRSVGKDSSDSSTSSLDSDDYLPLVHLPPTTGPIDLTTDHSAYNPAEVSAVLRRCNNARGAISAGVGGGIKRVAGSLAVTRALGDAYLKTPLLSFLPYKSHAPYITARPEVNCRPLVKDGDKVLILGTDGIWERASGEDGLRWVRNFYEERVAEAERRNNRRLSQKVDHPSSPNIDNGTAGVRNSQQETAERDLFEKKIPVIGGSISSNRKREQAHSPSLSARRSRKRSRHNRISYNVADVFVRRVLNKVRRARNISSLQALMSLPPGRARRSKHDDITASVVDLSAFVS